jgi:hypothetical protein
MRKIMSVLLAWVMTFTAIASICLSNAFAAEVKKTIVGSSFDLGPKDKYELSLGTPVDDAASMIALKGDISAMSDHDGVASFAVSSGNLAVMINVQSGIKLFEQTNVHDWHVVPDKGNIVDGTQLSQSIGTGAIVVQTSSDGKTWITIDEESDIYNKRDALNNRNLNGEPMQAFYKATNVQLTNGCYYRIIVAYKLQRELDPSKVLFLNVKNQEEKERVEVYQFYAYDPSVNRAESLDTNSAYEFGDVWRVDSQDGFKNPVMIKSDDPHIDWNVGKFYVSGYTDVRMDGDVPVFLKVPGDRAALWFVLEQQLDKCNGDTGIKVNYISSGSDIYFGTPTIANFGRGTLIVRRTDKQNKKERQIYTNYLEASATVGTNTRVDLFEEGDYEVALDYQLHYDKPFVFGTTTTKTLTYRMFFKFEVRNGDNSAFIRDVDTDQFITNANVAPHGFYIDIANSQYLEMSIKREVLSESADGLVEDTKFSGVAKEGRQYTEEGIYTVTIENPATGDSVVKRIYVGDRDILLAHMKTGMPIDEIEEQLAAGAYIDDQGRLLTPDPEEEARAEDPSETSDASEDTTEDLSADTTMSAQHHNTQRSANTLVLVSVAAAFLVSVAVVLYRKAHSRKGEQK